MTDPLEEPLLLYIILPACAWIIAAICVSAIANEKNRDTGAWLIYGLLFWPIALKHILAKEKLPPPEEYDDSTDVVGRSSPINGKEP